jgi:hypothetical protein
MKYFRPASVERTLSRRKRRDDVERQRLQLQPHVERDQVARRDHDHHAHDRQNDEHRVFEPQDVVPRHVILADQQDRRRRPQDRHLGEAGEGVVDEHPFEGHPRPRPGQRDIGPHDRQKQRRAPCQRGREPVLGGVDRPQKRPHREQRQDDFGQDDSEIGTEHVRFLSGSRRTGCAAHRPPAPRRIGSEAPRPRGRSRR